MGTEVANIVSPFHFCYARSAEDFDVIHREGVNLVIWRREQEPETAVLVDTLCAEQDVDVVAVLQAHDPDVWLLLSDLPPGRARDMLAADIGYLAKRFSKLAEKPALRARLETVHTDACRLFHVDVASLRLIVTYSGFGTQWASNDAVRRDQLTARGRSFEEANLAIVPRPTDIRATRPWWVLLQKGEAYPGNADNGIVHRSPLIEQTAERRLRLCLDVMR